MSRFLEPSTWAGFGVLLSVVFPFVGLSTSAAQAVASGVTALAGAVAMILREKGKA